MSGATTREKLIAAAFAVVARDGLEAASVKAIATEAGVTSGLLHYHFPTKDALIEAAMRASVADYLSRQAELRDLADLFSSAREAAEEDRTYFKMRLALAARALTDAKSAAIMAEVNRPAVAATAEALARAAGEPVGERHQLLATALKASFDGVMLAWLLDPDFPLEGVAQFLEQASRNWLAEAKGS